MTSSMTGQISERQLIMAPKKFVAMAFGDLISVISPSRLLVLSSANLNVFWSTLWQ